MEFVAPLAGARIEISDIISAEIIGMSLPSRERGLKFLNAVLFKGRHLSRAPRGSDD